MEITDINIQNILFYSSLPGFAAGVALFIYSLKKNFYKNNRFIAKFSLEVIGATITATFITFAISDSNIKIGLAFICGIGWIQIIQTIRNKITRVIEAVISENSKEGSA